MGGNMEGLAGRGGERSGAFVSLDPKIVWGYSRVLRERLNILPTLHPVKFSGRRLGLTFGPAIKGPRVTETSADIL